MIRRTQDEIEADFPLEAKKAGMPFEKFQEGMSLKEWKNQDKEENQEEDSSSNGFIRRTQDEIEADFPLEAKKAGMNLEQWNAGMTFEEYQEGLTIEDIKSSEKESEKTPIDVYDEEEYEREPFSMRNADEVQLKRIIEDITINLKYDTISLTTSEISIERMSKLGEKGYRYLFEQHGKYFFQKPCTSKEYEELQKKRDNIRRNGRRSL